jgi:uncharacterized RDD family membrane protein YckC
MAAETAPRLTGPDVPYAGIATRAVALAVDVAIAHVIVFAGGAILALIGSLVADIRLDTLARVLAAAAWLAVVGSYFVLFWSTAGQTPGMRLMGLRVMTGDGVHPGVMRSIVRVIGLGLAIVPLFAGFLPVLVDERRRGLHDLLAGTVVRYDGGAIPEIEVVRATPQEHWTAPLPPVPGGPSMDPKPPPSRSAP